MKEIVRDVCLYIAGALVIHFGMLYFFQNAVLADSVWLQGQQQYDAYGKPIETLVMGDSHMAMGMDVAELEAAFNFASPGENFVEMYYKLRHVLEERTNPPKRLVISLDYHSFTSRYTQEFDRNYYWGRYLDYDRIDQEHSGFLAGIGMYLIYKFPYISGANELLVYFLLPQQTEIRNGHIVSQNNFAEVHDRRTIAEERTRYLFRSTELITNESVEHLQKIIRLADEHDIEVFLVKMPVTREYHESSLRYIEDLDGFYAQIEQAANKAGAVTVLDFQTQWLDEPELFSDPDHLNATGSRRLALQLKSMLDSSHRQTLQNP